MPPGPPPGQQLPHLPEAMPPPPQPSVLKFSVPDSGVEVDLGSVAFGSRDYDVACDAAARRLLPPKLALATEDFRSVLADEEENHAMACELMAWRGRSARAAHRRGNPRVRVRRGGDRGSRRPHEPDSR